MPLIFALEPELQFRIEEWGAPGAQPPYVTLAASKNVIIARAAYEAAIREYGHRHVLLRQGARVMLERLPPPVSFAHRPKL